MSVSIAARFSKDERQYDGLAGIEKELIEEPLVPRVVVGVIETVRIATDVKTGTVTPTVRFRQIEVVNEAEAIKVTNMLTAAYSKRTGRDDVQPSLFDDQPSSADDEPWPGDVDDTPAQAADDDSQPASQAEPVKRPRRKAKEEGTSDG